MSPDAERQAIARLKNGDIGGLETLVKIYQVKAVRAAYLVAQDTALAEDIVQSAFIRAYERIAQFDAARPFGPWFLRSVVNDALKAVSRSKRTVSLEIADDWLSDRQPGPVAVLEAAQTREAVRAALAELSPEQRAAVVARYYLDLSESEMAEQTGSPPGTIKWRLHAGRKRLRALLSGLRNEDQT